MTLSRDRTAAHNRGDCDPRDCDLCALENICDGCGHGDEPTETCEHGTALCPDCAEDGYCRDCRLDQAAEDAADAAISRAREEW